MPKSTAADRLARLTALYGAEMAQDIVAGRPDRPPLDEALDRVKAGRNPAYDPTMTPKRLALDRIATVSSSPTPPDSVTDADTIDDPIRVAIRHLIQEELEARGL